MRTNTLPFSKFGYGWLHSIGYDGRYFAWRIYAEFRSGLLLAHWGNLA